MRIVIAGSSGLLGSALVDALRSSGDTVTRLVRRAPQEPDQVQWDPVNGELDVSVLEDTDAVINLGGVGLGDKRWTDEYKQQIISSRVSGAQTLAAAIAACKRPPGVFLQASAVGWYGSRGGDVLDESSPGGRAFLADVCRQWESAAHPAAAHTRVTFLRTGIVLSPTGGALGKMMPLIKLGLAGKLGSGDQFWPWITLADHVRAMRFLLTADVAGPVNLTAPTPQPNAQVIKAVAHAFGRPALIPVPEFALKIAIGEFATDILASQNVKPTKLLDAGLTFDYPDLGTAAAWVAGH